MPVVGDNGGQRAPRPYRVPESTPPPQGTRFTLGPPLPHAAHLSSCRPHTPSTARRPTVTLTPCPMSSPAPPRAACGCCCCCWRRRLPSPSRATRSMRPPRLSSAAKSRRGRRCTGCRGGRAATGRPRRRGGARAIARAAMGHHATRRTRYDLAFSAPAFLGRAREQQPNPGTHLPSVTRLRPRRPPHLRHR